MLKEEQRGALFRFVDAVAALQVPVTSAEREGQLRSIQEALCFLEMTFPVSFSASCVATPVSESAGKPGKIR